MRGEVQVMGQHQVKVYVRIKGRVDVRLTARVEVEAA